MQPLDLYNHQRALWDGLIRQEPAAWCQERSQYIRLLRMGLIEDFVSLSSESLPIFFSLFDAQDGFLVPAGDLNIPHTAMRDLCAFLPSLEVYSPILFQLWKRGTFDRMVFQVHSTSVDLKDTEKSSLVSSSLRQISLPPSTFSMGALPHDTQVEIKETPRHTVTLTRGVNVCAYACTQVLFEYVMGYNPSCFLGASRPVEQVSWCDAILFCNRLSLLQGKSAVYVVPEGLSDTCRNQRNVFSDAVDNLARQIRWNQDADGYRLPTEAEWEYAARGNSETIYAGSNDIQEVAWFQGNSSTTSAPVAAKRPNHHGLFDMCGNVWEWVWDTWLSNAYTRGTCVDPVIEAPSPARIVRGGGWSSRSMLTRATFRRGDYASSKDPGRGFRFVSMPSTKNV
ncbi:MAG: SUMF1/EgtB/PvdO family nonheme iron enzyme [Myxococcota bacterium]|nr:SUMF1/EgtB/PvdO family nonheme iron enzyme [Myxococcota bacterium]